MKKLLFSIMTFLISVIIFWACKETTLLPDSTQSEIISKYGRDAVPNKISNPNESSLRLLAPPMTWTAWGIYNAKGTIGSPLPQNPAWNSCQYEMNNLCPYTVIRSLDGLELSQVTIDATESIVWIALDKTIDDEVKLFFNISKHGEQVLKEFETQKKEFFTIEKDFIIPDNLAKVLLENEYAQTRKLMIPEGKYAINYEDKDYPLGKIIFDIISYEAGIMTPEIIDKISINKEFQEALDILEENGEYIDMKEGKVFLDERGASTISFEINKIDQSTIVDYTKLIYTTSDEGKESVYFDEKNMTNEDKSARKSIINGCHWSDWTSTGKGYFCEYNWWCGKKRGRQATYDWEWRFKCSNGVRKKEQFRRVKKWCGGC